MSDKKILDKFIANTDSNDLISVGDKDILISKSKLLELLKKADDPKLSFNKAIRRAINTTTEYMVTKVWKVDRTESWPPGTSTLIIEVDVRDKTKKEKHDNLKPILRSLNIYKK